METSIDKTKREIANHLTTNQWLYQYSVFFDVSDMDHNTAKVLAIEWFDRFDDIKFRDYLRKTSDTAILFVIRTTLIRNRSDNKRFRQVYLTLYCNHILDLDEVVYNYIDNDEAIINVIHRKVKPNKLITTASTIKNQDLHNLDFLQGKKRYSLINKKLLIKHDV